MKKRFSLFSIAAMAFVLALAFGMPTDAGAGSNVNSTGTYSGSSYDKDMAARDSGKPDTSMGGMGQHAETMDKGSMAGMDLVSMEGLTAEQHVEYSLMPKAHREIISKLDANQRREFFTLSREERDRFLSFNAREREVFLTLKPEERTAFMAFTVREREMFVDFHPDEREVFLALSPTDRQTYVSLKPGERHLFLTLKPEERALFFTLDRQERNRFFAAKPDERHRMLSRAATTARDAEKGEMSSKGADMPSKDADRPREMKSGENGSDRWWYWRDERKGHDRGTSDKDMGKGSNMNSDGYSAPTNKGSEM